MNVIKNRKIFLTIAVVLVALSWLAIGIFGLKPGIDLAGGSQWRVAFENPSITAETVEEFLLVEMDSKVSVKTISDDSFIIRTKDLSEEDHQIYKKALVEELGAFDEKSFISVGPVIGAEFKRKSIRAMLGVLAGISLFVAWAFRAVSKPISSWKYGLTVLITLFHDVSIPAGFFAVMGFISGVEVDTTFIVALLVVLGFSVNDTIVVFDRIRENIILNKDKRRPLEDVINMSINETIMRSVNTSLTLVLVLLSLLIFGPQSIFFFVLTILIGTVVGTYSSIFVASPLLYLWGKSRKQ